MAHAPSFYYAVESLAQLAARGPARPCSSEALAGSMGCSVPFTRQLMQQLCRAGYVKERGGLQKGYRLSRPAHRISIADVFRALDGLEALGPRLRPLKHLSPTDIEALSGPDLLWQALNGCIELFLRDITLADVIDAREATLARVPDRAVH